MSRTHRSPRRARRAPGFSSATVTEFPGQPRGKCPGRTKRHEACKQWCLLLDSSSVACCNNHRLQRDVETAKGVVSYVHPNCGECKAAVSASAGGEEIDFITGESTHTVCTRAALARMCLDIGAIGPGVSYFAITEMGIERLGMQLLMNPELQEALRSAGGVVGGVLSSFLGDPVARAKAGAPLSVTLKWLRDRGVKVYSELVPDGYEGLSTPQRNQARLQGGARSAREQQHQQRRWTWTRPSPPPPPW